VPKQIKKTTWLGIALLGLALAPIFALSLMSMMDKRPDSLGVRDGQLQPCPDKPNCVHSQSGDSRHAMDPLPFSGSPEDAMRRLKQVIADVPRARIVSGDGRYLHAEFDSFLFRFTDDVEFLIDDENSVIHFRSASRIGYSDLGANRRRMEKIRDAFAAAQ